MGMGEEAEDCRSKPDHCLNRCRGRKRIEAIEAIKGIELQRIHYFQPQIHTDGHRS